MKDSDANFVEISVITGWKEDASEGITCASLDVPKFEFEAMLERASKHRGYQGNQRDVHEIVTRDATLQQCEHADDKSLMSLSRARVVAKHLVDSRPFEGTPLLVRTYRRSVHPFSAFPCDAPVHSRRKVRRLELRIHSDARLVFETIVAHRQSLSSSTKVVRRVHIEIELKKRDTNVQRTIENTIQVVLLGMAPQGKGLQLGRSKNGRP